MQVWSTSDVTERVNFIRTAQKGNYNSSFAKQQLFNNFHVDSEDIDQMLHNSPDNDLSSLLDLIPSERQFHGAASFIPRMSTPLSRRHVDPRQPPPPELAKAYSYHQSDQPGSRNFRPSASAGPVRDGAKPANQAQTKKGDETPIIKRTRKVITYTPLIFSKLPEETYINSVIEASSGPSLLLRALKGERQAPTPVNAGSDATKGRSALIKITVYLPLPPLQTPEAKQPPKPKAVHIRLPRSDACSVVINKLLARKQVRQHLCHLDLPVQPGEFVLRLHDEDGLPMDGFVPCKAENTIEEINDDAFCLCIVESRPETKIPAPRRIATTGAFKVHLPHSDINMTSFPVRKYSCLAEVLRRHLLNQDHVSVGQEFDFYLLPADQKRLKRKSPRLNPNIPLTALVKQFAIEEVEVRTRSYRDIPTGGDSPAENDTPPRGSLPASFDPVEPTPQPGPGRKPKNRETINRFEVIWGQYEAYSLQEWNLIKVNARGRKQARIIAVDQKFIYNRRQRTLGFRTDTKRLISDLATVEWEPNDCPEKFRLIFKKDAEGKQTVINYIAKTPKQAATIVTKIKYIRDRL